MSSELSIFAPPEARAVGAGPLGHFHSDRRTRVTIGLALGVEHGAHLDTFVQKPLAPIERSVFVTPSVHIAEGRFELGSVMFNCTRVSGTVDSWYVAHQNRVVFAGPLADTFDLAAVDHLTVGVEAVIE